MGDEFGELKEKVKDIFVFLVEHGFAEKLAELPKHENPIRVTYHDPCHLRNHGITKEPRAILQALPQVEYIEMENAGTCCGLGGTYSVYHYDTSKKIGAKKAGFIAESGAELVATDCPGCMMQLQDSINHAKEKQRAVHILDLVAEALPE
jgi:glycolate oxidase iron-sulfur subunit